MLTPGGESPHMDDHYIPRLALIITLFGVLPFVGLSVIIASHPSNVELILNPLFTYAAVILSFLAGIHWGIAVLHAQEGKPDIAMFMYIESAFITLLAWLCLLIGEPYMRLLAYAFLFAVAWGLDSVLHSSRLIPTWYFNLRGISTPIVVVSMYVAYFSII